MSNTTNQLAHPEKVTTEVLRVQALELRMGGATFRQIAQALKIDVSTAHDYVTTALAEVKEHSFELAQDVRDMDLARLDAMLLALWPKRKEPRAADTLLRILERRAKLTGADAPVRWEGSGIGGAPIAIQAGVGVWDLEKLTVEQLRELDRLMEIASPAAIEAPPTAPSTEPEKPEVAP